MLDRLAEGGTAECYICRSTSGVEGVCMKSGEKTDVYKIRGAHDVKGQVNPETASVK